MNTRILIVDDDQTTLKLLQAQLEAEGYQVFSAVDGVEALALLQHQTVDAVISDVLMPRMDGYRLCYEVRTDEQLRHLRFVLYSSTYTSPSDEKLAFDLTADAFLRRPASPQVILETLRSLPCRDQSAALQPISQVDELGLVKEFSERLVSKLEKKNVELQAQAETLQKSEAQLLLQTRALEAASNSIVITDARGAILWVNPAFSRLTGFPPEEVVGENTRIYKSGVHDAAFYGELWKTILKGETWRGEITNRRKDGTLWTSDQTVTPVRGEGGQITHFIGIMNDITERKHLEEGFAQSQKMELIGQLASGVAHDFNNILAVIRGYCDLMSMDLGPDSPAESCCSEIRHATDRASALTQQLLIFSRRQTVQLVVLDLNQILANIEKMLRRLITENISLTILPGNEIGCFKADANYVGQILMNLIVNARDAMPKGGKISIETAKITLDEAYARAHPEALPGEYVMLAVTDWGTGMTDEVKARLFEPFFTTKPKGKGTGLGLATCLTIAKQFRGHIDVQSDLGHGTTFRVYFPCVHQPAEAQVRGVQPGCLPRGTETLLLVEDEPSVRHLAHKVLAAQGYEVLSANNGHDALNVVRTHKGAPISLVVTDVIMPQMGGKVMADWLKTSHPELKFLFTSGYTDDTLADQGVLDPDIEFMYKPYSPSTIIRKVRQMLDVPATKAHG